MKDGTPGAFAIAAGGIADGRAIDQRNREKETGNRGNNRFMMKEEKQPADCLKYRIVYGAVSERREHDIRSIGSRRHEDGMCYR